MLNERILPIAFYADPLRLMKLLLYESFPSLLSSLILDISRSLSIIPLEIDDNFN